MISAADLADRTRVGQGGQPRTEASWSTPGEEKTGRPSSSLAWGFLLLCYTQRLRIAPKCAFSLRGVGAGWSGTGHRQGITDRGTARRYGGIEGGHGQAASSIFSPTPRASDLDGYRGLLVVLHTSILDTLNLNKECMPTVPLCCGAFGQAGWNV